MTCFYIPPGSERFNSADAHSFASSWIVSSSATVSRSFGLPAAFDCDQSLEIEAETVQAEVTSRVERCPPFSTRRRTAEAPAGSGSALRAIFSDFHEESPIDVAPVHCDDELDAVLHTVSRKGFSGSQTSRFIFTIVVHGTTGKQILFTAPDASSDRSETEKKAPASAGARCCGMGLGPSEPEAGCE